MASDVRRPVRSFVRRQGRITPAQRNALSSLWPRYGLYPDVRLDQPKVFGRQAPLVLEVGFGDGEVLARLAQQFPEKDFLGIEVHQPGVGHLLMLLDRLGLSNVRVYCQDAVEVLNRSIPDSSLDGANIFFPDPWPKKRHHKRRLIHGGFVGLLSGKLKAGAVLHIATDWSEYSDWIRAVLDGCTALEPLGGGGLPGMARPMTKFECRGTGMGLQVTEFLYRRCR